MAQTSYSLKRITSGLKKRLARLKSHKEAQHAMTHLQKAIEVCENVMKAEKAPKAKKTAKKAA